MDLYLYIILSFVDITYACVQHCTCNQLMIKGHWLKTLSCPRRNISHFPTGVDNTTQFMRLEGNHISDIPYNLSQLLPDLQRIDMSDNKVTRLRSRIFAGLKNLNAVNFVNNEITTIEDHIFEGSESKRMNLKLRGNKLKDIHEDAFRGLYANSAIDLRDNSLKRLYPNTLNGVRIMTLDLTHNQLDGLPDELFQHQDQLYFLELGENNISSLSDRIFRGLSSLETLDLSSNKLRELPDNLFKQNKLLAITLNLETNQFATPPSLNQPAKVIVTLKNNPIICDCDLKRLLSNTSYKVEVTDIDMVVCVNDTRTVTKMLREIDCRTTTPAPTTTTPAPTTNSTYTSTIVSTNATETTKTYTTSYPTTIKQHVNTTSLHKTLLITPSIEVKVKPGVTRLTVLVSSMITVVVFVMVGVFCYVKRQTIVNIVRCPFKSYDVERRLHQENLCSNANDEFHIAGWDNHTTTAAFAKLEGNSIY